MGSSFEGTRLHLLSLGHETWASMTQDITLGKHEFFVHGYHPKPPESRVRVQLCAGACSVL